MLLLLFTFVAVTLCVLITRCPAQQTKTVPSLLLPGRVYSLLRLGNAHCCQRLRLQTVLSTSCAAQEPKTCICWI